MSIKCWQPPYFGFNAYYHQKPRDRKENGKVAVVLLYHVPCLLHATVTTAQAGVHEEAD